MERTINLLDFCKKHGFECIIPARVMAKLIEARLNGAINKRGFEKCIQLWFDNLLAVGVTKDGKPMGLWKV